MSEYMGPDLNAPRYRKSIHSPLDKKFFKEFKEKYPQYKHLKNNEIRNIICVANQHLWKTVVHERDGVELPQSLGFLFIGTCPRAKKRVNTDFKKSKELKRRVLNKNWECDGKVGKIFYSNYNVKYKLFDRSIWGFEGHRDFTRYTSKIYRTNYQLYIVADQFKYLSKLFKKHYNIYRAKRLTKDVIENVYNEFDI